MLLAGAMALAAQAQVVNVASVQRLDVPTGEATAVAAAMGPRGDYLLLTSDTQQGLVKWDMATGQTATLSTAPGAGFDVRLSADGQQVIYREKSLSADNLVLQSAKAVDLATGERATLIAPTHDFQGYAMAANVPVTMQQGRARARARAGQKAPTAPVLTSSNLLLYVTQNGQTRLLAPQGQEVSYIWGSISPDGTRVLYYCGDLGQAFVCNLDGSGVQPLGDVTAPVWLDNGTIVGMNDADDGELLLSSAIVAVRLSDGATQTLTDASLKAIYPCASADGSKIAFTNNDGGIYLITLTR